MVEEAIFVRLKDTILFKKAIAKVLYSNKIEQSKISEILNLTQPMVSNYLGSKEKIPKKFLDLADNISAEIKKGKKITFHTSISFNNESFEGRYYIAKNNEIISNERVKIIDNLTEAFQKLKGQNIGRILPKVKVNIAMAMDNAESPEDVGAFVNGLIIVDDVVSSINGIRFGKSKHLSKLLIYLKSKIEVNAIMNIAYFDGINNSAMKFSSLSKDFKLGSSKEDIDILLHDGDFGIEPCAYVLGKDAIEVTKKVLKITHGLKNEK
jgi:predicted fused transcriptional regulator/phosphomethylpyrimidine kinase